MTSQVSIKYKTETRQSLLIGTNWKVFPSKKSGTVPLVTIAVTSMPKKDSRRSRACCCGTEPARASVTI